MALLLHDFAKLMLARLAKETRVINFYHPEEKVASIPFDYRERIQNILCEDNGWEEEFAVLIKISEYFDDHFYWEQRLAEEILAVTQELNKKLEFDIVREYMTITFHSNEIQEITEDFDESIVNTMDHFVSLIISGLYSRRHREQIFDHTARSVAKMHERWENKRLVY